MSFVFSLIDNMGVEQLSSILNTVFAGIMAIFVGTMFLRMYTSIFTKGLKFSLRVAVIGLPRSGKTTLITVVFDSIMSGKLAKYVSVSGSETIDRLTQYLTRIHHGINLGPTKDDDVFAYRYIVDRKRFGIIPTKHDVEIADFPGEYSKKLSENMNDQIMQNGLFDKQFFSWIIRADKYIFVIDAQAYLQSLANKINGELNYVSAIEIAFKNAVFQLKQELLDERIYERPILLVFTKCDSFLIEEDKLKVDGKEINLIYHDARFNELLNDVSVIKSVDERIEKMFDDFDNLLSFLKSNFRKVEIVVHSSYWEKGGFAKGSQKVIEFASPQ